MCFVRARENDAVVLTTYGRSSGFCIDPIEKKPLDHFYPGSSVLSFGTAGCNLACQFCQNWDISKSREVRRLADEASPDAIAEAAEAYGCKSVAFTYNDPVIFFEYAVDVAHACHERGIKTVAVTAGYVTEEPARSSSLRSTRRTSTSKRSVKRSTRRSVRASWRRCSKHSSTFGTRPPFGSS